MVDHSKFEKLDIQLLGISGNNPFSQKMFATSMGLSYPLRTWSRGRAGQQRLLMGDPSEVQGCAFEPASHRFNQQGKGRTTPNSTGLAKREHPLHPPVTLLTQPCKGELNNLFSS